MCQRVQLALLLSVLLSYASSQRTSEDLTVAESWRVIESWTKGYVDAIVPRLEAILDTTNLSPTCEKHSRMVLKELLQLKPSAAQMLDSWAKFPSGFLSGVSGLHGDFDECLELQRPDGLFRGQYCNIQTKQPVPHIRNVHRLTVNSRFTEFAQAAFDNNTILQDYVRDRIVWYYRYSYKIGVCLPSTCTIQDVNALVKEGLKELQWEVNISDCQVAEDKIPSSLQTAVFAGFGAVFLIVLLSTILDVSKEESDTRQSWSDHFSLVRNWRSLTSSPASGSRLTFFDGIRVFVVHWTILLHTFSMYEPAVLAGCFSAVQLVSKPVFQLIMNAWVSVDSFFCISGFLLGTSLLRNLERNEGKVNWITFILKRVCRLSPTIWAVMGIMFVIPLFGSGAHWPQNFQADVDRCHKSWLPVVLFISNWVNFDDMCLPQSWYISADFQLYIIGSVCVYFLYKPNFGWKLCLSGITLSSAWISYVVYVNDLQPSIIWETFDENFRTKMLHLTYFGPVPHLASSLIGVLASYLLHRYPKMELRESTIVFLWTLSSATLLSVLLVAHPWHNGDWPTTEVAAIYQGLHRVVWCAASAWALFACAQGYGGIANKLLSWSGWTTLAKLSFGMGMLNIPIIRFKNAILRRHITFGLTDMYYDFLGHYSMCIAFSAFLYLMVEAPFASLSERFFADKKKKKS